MMCFAIFSSVRECSCLSASMKFQIVGLVQLTILLKPLCRPSARLEDLGNRRWWHPTGSIQACRRGDQRKMSQATCTPESQRRRVAPSLVVR